MARITGTLIAKSGWRPCIRCRAVTEYGSGCESCTTTAERLIRSAMTPAVLSLVNEARNRLSAEIAADARP